MKQKRKRNAYRLNMASPLFLLRSPTRYCRTRHDGHGDAAAKTATWIISLVPVGGGGLAAGVAVLIKQPDARD